MLYRSLHKRNLGTDASDTSSDDSDTRRPSQVAPGRAGASNGTGMLIFFVVVCLVAAGGAAYILLRREPSAGAGAGGSSATSFSTLSAATRASGTGAATATRNLSTSASSSASLGDDCPSPSTSSSTVAPSSTSTSDGGSTDVDQSSLKAQGISTFLGNNTGGIASWYHTDSGTDSTNGRSWCEFPYDDTVPGLAPSLATMLSSFSQDAAAAKTAFCGLAAEVYSPKTGKTVTLYIANAFDDTWVRTPASIDVIYGSFELLFGETTDNKNDVVKECWWQLTGEREEKYTYKGVGVG